MMSSASVERAAVSVDGAFAPTEGVDAARARIAALPPERAAAARMLLARRGRPERAGGTPVAGAGPAVGRVPRTGQDFPCSSEQHRIWLSDQLDADRATMPNAT